MGPAPRRHRLLDPHLRRVCLLRLDRRLRPLGLRAGRHRLPRRGEAAGPAARHDAARADLLLRDDSLRADPEPLHLRHGDVRQHRADEPAAVDQLHHAHRLDHRRGLRGEPDLRAVAPRPVRAVRMPLPLLCQRDARHPAPQPGVALPDLLAVLRDALRPHHHPLLRRGAPLRGGRGAARQPQHALRLRAVLAPSLGLPLPRHDGVLHRVLRRAAAAGRPRARLDHRGRTRRPLPHLHLRALAVPQARDADDARAPKVLRRHRAHRRVHPPRPGGAAGRRRAARRQLALCGRHRRHQSHRPLPARAAAGAAGRELRDPRKGKGGRRRPHG
mmetsp:Transcript_94/g.312  ORF Transcript_94/g.312 Transcript_94/m.312 type:complete len:330 (-) Transcript_94:1873-2862(-)